ncbi:hypothetical protein GCM10010211_60650 [Streptomyces albospinus]|uniref:Uncharacterized protein n=1 Tax=Streptomyces albospinus TaxID=285515 RepID=A0ABQ2VHU4_9ACTN|nr:hypothetical protein GCM10010211_60650 [Streptomyces albospinus]
MVSQRLREKVFSQISPREPRPAVAAWRLWLVRVTETRAQAPDLCLPRTPLSAGCGLLRPRQRAGCGDGRWAGPCRHANTAAGWHLAGVWINPQQGELSLMRHWFVSYTGQRCTRATPSQQPRHRSDPWSAVHRRRGGRASRAKVALRYDKTPVS